MAFYKMACSQAHFVAFSHIYNQDVTSLRNANRYSIYDKDLAASLHSEIAKGDEAKIDEQIRQFKEDEIRVRKPVYKNLQNSLANDTTKTSVPISTPTVTITPSEQPLDTPPPSA